MENKITNKNWNLSKISDDASLDELIDIWKKTVLYEHSIRKNAFDSLQNFKKWWFTYLKAVNLDNKTRIVAKEFEDNKNKSDQEKDWLSEYDRACKEIAPAKDKAPSIYKMMIKNSKKVKQYLAKDKDLAKYKIKIQLDFLNSEGHSLTEEEEKIEKATWGTSAFEDIYESLHKDRVYDFIRDENGKIVEELKYFGQGLRSWNKNIRRETFITWYSPDVRLRNTYLSLAFCVALRLHQSARRYKFHTYTDQTVSDNLQLKLKDYYFIINQCEKFASLNLKFNSYNNKLIADAYGLEKLEPWDSELSIGDTKDSITNKQAEELIIDALSCLGPEYIEKVKKCFSNNIIKWTKSDAGDKHLNGYCWAGYPDLDEHPIKFDWTGCSQSAATLAHELGHNIKDKFMKQNNEVNVTVNECLSEIPSIVNSVILNLHILKKFKANKVPTAQIYGMYIWWVNYILRNICTYGYYLEMVDALTNWMVDRQANVTCDNFENYALDLRKKYEGIFVADYKKALHNKYPYNLVKLDGYKDYLTLTLKSPRLFNYYIASIIATVVGTRIYNGDKQMLAKYLKFLKSGTTTDPVKLIQSTLGINITKPQIYTEAKQILNRLVNDFIKDIKVDKPIDIINKK